MARQNGAQEVDVLRDQLADREAELAEVQKQLQQVERDGQEIAVRAEAIITELRRENAQLRQATQEANPLCRPCESKRRNIAVLVGIMILAVWFRIKVTGHAVPELAGRGILVAMSPLIGVCVHWRWLLFKRKYTWVAWNDNDIYRSLARRWNEALETVRLR